MIGYKSYNLREEISFEGGDGIHYDYTGGTEGWTGDAQHNGIQQGWSDQRGK